MKSIYSQFLYWLALRLSVTNSIVGLKRPLTVFQLRRAIWSHEIMQMSSRLMAEMRAEDQAQFEYEQSLTRTMRAISHNPNRKNPVDPVVY